jgi:hypothetical protein
MLRDYDAVRIWKEGLHQGSKEVRGFGYRLEYEAVNHRQMGVQHIPSRIVVDTEEDFLRLLGRRRDFARFVELCKLILATQPALKPYLEQGPSRVLEHEVAWPPLLAVCDYVLRNPRCDRYLRELDIPGVETKFIERNRVIIAELLDALLPAGAVDGAAVGLAKHGFERRFGFRFEEPRVRFRLLDPGLQLLGSVTDLEVPLSQFAALDPPCRRVYLTENKMNGLVFPAEPEAMVVFGLGYGIEMLKGIEWLAEAEIVYWGDIDTHGFAILSQLRGYFPQVRSLLMDLATLEQCRPLWGEEDMNKRCLKELAHLTEAESVLYDLLRNDRLAPRLRLEQERISYGILVEALAGDTSCTLLRDLVTGIV